MGLDMMLYVVHKDYVSTYTKNDNLKLEYPKELLKHITYEDKCIIQNTYYEVAYWRKANHIHNWFVQNCADGIDNCQPISVSINDLIKLLDTCEHVLNNHEDAKTFLPTQSGFFFGSTDYNDYYFEDIKQTISYIKPIIRFMEEQEENYKWHIEYQASW